MTRRAWSLVVAVLTIVFLVCGGITFVIEAIAGKPPSPEFAPLYRAVYTVGFWTFLAALALSVAVLASGNAVVVRLWQRLTGQRKVRRSAS